MLILRNTSRHVRYHNHIYKGCIRIKKMNSPNLLTNNLKFKFKKMLIVKIFISLLFTNIHFIQTTDYLPTCEGVRLNDHVYLQGFSGKLSLSKCFSSRLQKSTEASLIGVEIFWRLDWILYLLCILIDY